MKLLPAILPLALFLQACPSPTEGSRPGECSDGADNDADGLFDCLDDDCADAPACADATPDPDTDTETDTDTDTDSDTDTDTDPVLPPTQPTVEIQPVDPTTASLLEAVVTVPSTSPDGGSVSYQYEWFQNSSATEFNLATLSSIQTAKGQDWTVRVTPVAGGVTGAAAQATVVIGNAPPNIDVAEISPSTLTAGDTATCSWDGFVDPDGDADQSRPLWQVDGVPAGSGSQLSAPLQRGQTITCVVQASDGEDDGNRATTQRVVQNSPPAAVGVSITPDFPLENDRLTCVGEATDLDGDADLGQYRWLVDGIAAGTGTVLDGPHRVGSTVSCEYTPNDGTDSGITLSTDTLIWDCGANASSVGSNTCACEGQYEWCSNDPDDPLYIDCCAYWTDTFEVIFEEAMIHPVRADEQPWDWDGSVPGWLTSLVAALHEVDDLVGFCDSQPSLPVPTVTGAAIFLACNSDSILSTVDEYGPQILEGTVPPDPQLWAYFDTGDQSVDWFAFDHPDNDYQPVWYAGGDMFLSPNETLRFEVWDDDALSDDLIGRLEFDLLTLQTLSGRGSLSIQAGQLNWANISVEPLPPAP